MEECFIYNKHTGKIQTSGVMIYWEPNDVYDWEDAPMGDNSEVVKLRAYLERNAYE